MAEGIDVELLESCFSDNEELIISLVKTAIVTVV